MPEYGVWCRMIDRCYNPNIPSFSNYGGRGIIVCERWRHDFAAFLADVGPRPSPAHSIDRIDNDGNYEPGNVRWATKHQQMRNTRFNVVIEWRGEKRCLFEWAVILGINAYTLHARLRRRGWTIERAMTTPVKKP